MVARRALSVYLLTILVLTLAALSIVWYQESIRHRNYPKSSLLFIVEERFSDLTHYSEKCSDFQAGKGFRGGEEPLWIYPAPSAYVQCLLLNDTPNPVFAITLITALVAALAALMLWWKCKAFPTNRRLSGWVIVATFATSYPIAYAIDRGQMEAIMMGLTLLFLVFFIQKKYLLAALSLVLAACIKPYAVVFFVLLLFRRRFREIGIAAVVFIALNYAALAGFGTSIAESYKGIQDGWAWFVETRACAIVPTEIGFDHALFSVLKRFVKLCSPGDDLEDSVYKFLYQSYFVVAAIAGLGVLYRIWRMPLLNQFFALTIAIVLLPWVSYDYTVMEIYLPWGLFIIFLLEGHRTTLRQALFILIPCAVAFTPQSYLYIGDSAFGGQVKAAALLILFLSVLWIRMPLSMLHESDA